MSNKYKHGDRVPTDVLAARLDELSKAVTKGREEVARTFTMRVPAELDHCPDLVLSAAATRLTELERDAERYQKLRLMHWSDGGIAVAEQASSIILGHGTLSHERLDAAIDSCPDLTKPKN